MILLGTMATSPTTQTDQTANSTTDLRSLFPVLHLLRASGLAIDPRKMLLGGIALVLLAAGNWLFEGLPFAPDGLSIVYHELHETSVFSSTRALGCAGFMPRPQPVSWYSWDTTAYLLLTPVRSLVEPCRVLFQIGNSWSELAFAWTQLLWALIVWSLFGGALCRMNALQFAARKRIGLLEALKFSRRQWQSYLVAPMLPLSAVLILQGFNWLLGCLASLAPAIGDVVLGIGWCIVLFSGFLMTMLILGLAFGWPLMIAAISTEDSDGFDGLSRTFGYLFDRPWHAALFALSSLPVFAASRILLAFVIGLTVTLGADAITRGYDADATASYFSEHVRPASNGLAVSPAGSVAGSLELALAANSVPPLPNGIPELPIAAWTFIPALLFAGFSPAFFWSATTVTYFLLRNSDDGTPLDSVVDWSDQNKPEPSTDRTAEVEPVSSTTGE